MRPIGFSTGALALADFREGLRLTREAGCAAVELSALRESELDPLLDSLIELDLSAFGYVSIHAPSQFRPGGEAKARERLAQHAWRGWPIVLHPDSITDFAAWRELGGVVCIENMDKRKPIGRTAAELAPIFEQLPEATFCFDIGHSRQCDSTMVEAERILRDFGPRLRQVHVSEVSSTSRHDVLSFASMRAFREIADLIPAGVPLILETPAAPGEMRAEMAKASEVLG